MKCCKLTWIGLLLLVAGAIAIAVGPVIGQSAEEGAQDPMMEAWIAAGMPGDHHQYLTKMEGTFDATMTYWMYPGAEASTSKGVMKNEMIWEGRYLVSDYDGDMEGVPFKGRSTWGFNNVSKRFEGTWIDSMSTMISTSVGTCSADGTEFTMIATMYDPMTSEKITQRQIIKIHSKDKHVMEFYQKGPDGKEFKGMEIVYTR